MLDHFLICSYNLEYDECLEYCGGTYNIYNFMDNI